MISTLRTLLMSIANQRKWFIFAFSLLLAGSIFEYIFLHRIFEIISKFTSDTEFVSGVDLKNTIVIFLLKIIIQVLATFSILKAVQKLNTFNGFWSLRNNLGATGVNINSAVKAIQSNVFYIGDLIKSALFCVQDIFIIIVACAALFSSTGIFGAVVVSVVIALLSVSAIIMKDYLVALGRKRAEILSEIVVRINEFHRHWNLFVVSHRESNVRNLMAQKVETLYHYDYVRGLLSSLPRHLIDVLLLAILLVWAIFSLNINQDIMGFLLIASLRVFPLLGRLLANAQIMLFNLSALQESIDQSEVSCAIEDSQESRTYTDWNQIKVKNLSISVESHNIISNLSFDISPGQKMSIFGRNGSGKSTLLKVLLGLCDTNLVRHSGDILVDTKQVPDLATAIDISYISQDVPIFSGTILDNICLDFTSGDREAEITSILECVASLPQTQFLKTFNRNVLLTEVSPEFPVFSGGEWQQVAILRAFHRGSKFLVIDEGNSALDFENSAIFVKFLCSLSWLTLVFVNHRVSDQKYFDRILNLNA